MDEHVIVTRYCQLVQQLLLKEGFTYKDSTEIWRCDTTAIEAEVFNYGEFCSVHIHRRRIQDVTQVIKYAIATERDGTKGIFCNVTKATAWGLIDCRIPSFEFWLENLKYSLNQTDDLLIVQELRRLQGGLLKEQERKVQAYDETILRLKTEQKAAVEFQKALKPVQKVIASPPLVSSNPGAIRRLREGRSYATYLPVNRDSPPLKRASRVAPAKNLRPRPKAGQK